MLLNEHHFYDQEGRFWYARDLLRKGQWAPFQKFALVVVDGFADFTRTQHEPVPLAHATDELFISLPWDDCRGDLFHKSQNTLGELAGACRVWCVKLCRVVLQLPENRSVRPFAISSRLYFAIRGRSTPLSGRTAWKSSWRRAGQARSSCWRTIKRLLVEGEAGECTGPVPPGDVLVVFRSTSEVAALVREIFFEYGIPLAIDCGVVLSEHPPSRH